MVRAFYLYFRENRAEDFAVTWSDWLAAHSRTEVLQVGQQLDGEGFSSDQQVVSDALEALSAGEVVVLSGDTVLYITVE